MPNVAAGLDVENEFAFDVVCSFAQLSIEDEWHPTASNRNHLLPLLTSSTLYWSLVVTFSSPKSMMVMPVLIFFSSS
jgi:hypothetical protein